MRNMLDKYLFSFPREAEGASGANGGAGAAAAGDGSGGKAAGGAPSSASGGQGGEQQKPAGGEQQKPAAGGEQQKPAGPYYPEGIADNLKGKDERETLDRLAGALKGYRDRDAQKDLPEKPEGWLSTEGIDPKVFKVDDAFKAHFDHFGKDPGMLAAAKVAQKHGIPRPAFLEAMQESMRSLQEAGMLEPMVDEKAERMALLPDAAKALPEAEQSKAIDKRMSENADWLVLMQQNRGLPKDVSEYAEMMLFDTAKGHKFFEWVRSQVTGGDGNGPGAHGQPGGGADTAESLKAEMSKPELTPGHPSFDKAKYEAFDARYKAFHSAKK